MSKNKIDRREFIKRQLAGMAALSLPGALTSGCGGRNVRETERKVIALGMDGMDPKMVKRMMEAGELPTFAKMARRGSFGALGTSDPPQSPVAWANFISGGNPGRHGIYDFVHRDPETYIPFLSTSQAESSPTTIAIGDTVIPLSSGSTENLRRGLSFWEVLADHGVPATVFRIPSNFPPTGERQRTLSGMGTPDVLGSYGMFSYYTDKPLTLDSTLGGGEIHDVRLEHDKLRAELTGPENTFDKNRANTKAEFSLYRDPLHKTARIDLQGQEFLLEQGEWSPWVRVTFDFVLGVSVTGICRFYLKEAHPDFKLYVSAVHIDPADPMMPISTPDSYVSELADRFGRFHTKGLPADTKALDQGVLDDHEFLEQDDRYLEENLEIYDYELSRFENGLLFYYISSTDQRSHMFWRLTDPDHPMYDAEQAARLGSTMRDVYKRMDRMLARTLDRIDERTTVVAFSDHGFAPYYRSFHLNSWLMDRGYLVPKDPSRRAKGELSVFGDVDWEKSKAYAMGFNALYINTKGRESRGSVPAGEAERTARRIATELEEARDPVRDSNPVRRACVARDCYRGQCAAEAPDIMVGYNHGYRASWQTALGNIPDHLLDWNENKWSGDHCLDATVVPGMFISNVELEERPGFSLYDMTATVLDSFGVPIPEQMDGTSALKKT